MSLARAFTTRRVKNIQAAEGDSFPQRSNTIAKAGSLRHKISSPMELIHTTNMLAYNAPDLYPKSASTASSARSDDGMSDGAGTAASSPPTSPDVPPQRSMSPEPNHLSCYFTAPGQPLPTIVAAHGLKPSPSFSRQEPPVIPKRSPSHTKKASIEALNRHRSVSRNSEQSSRTLSSKASFSYSRTSSASTNTSTSSHMSTPGSHQQPYAKMSSTPGAPHSPLAAKQTPPPVQYYQHRIDHSVSHPFGQELAQVREIAEDYGVNEKLHTVDEESQHLAAHGLLKFTADEYMAEIQGLLTDLFTDSFGPSPAALWI